MPALPADHLPGLAAQPDTLRTGTLAQVASACLGPRFKKWTELLLVISQTGFCVAYLIFIGTNLAPFSGLSKVRWARATLFATLS